MVSFPSRTRTLSFANRYGDAHAILSVLPIRSLIRRRSTIRRVRNLDLRERGRHHPITLKLHPHHLDRERSKINYFPLHLLANICYTPKALRFNQVPLFCFRRMDKIILSNCFVDSSFEPRNSVKVESHKEASRLVG